MFNLIANAMFDATRTTSFTPAPVRKGWMRTPADTCSLERHRWSQAGKTRTEHK